MIKPFSLGQEEEINALICAVFNDFVGYEYTEEGNHICLFFVHEDHHNKGIGRKLFNEVLEKINGKTNFIDVNASPFSVGIYAKLGF